MNIQLEMVNLPNSLVSNKLKQYVNIDYDPHNRTTTINISADTVTLGVAAVMITHFFEKNLSVVPEDKRQHILEVIKEAKEEWTK